MEAGHGLRGRRVSISGSAGQRGNEQTDQDLLRRCHAFVHHLTLGILRAGGQIVAFIGDEPLLDPVDTRTAKVFYWTQLEAIAEYLPERSQTHKDRPLLFAIVSLKTTRGGIPAPRLGLWEHLLTESAVEQTPIDNRDDFGGHQRERQAEVADVLVTLGGGRGIFDLRRKFRERGAAVVPLDARTGSSCNDADGGEASRELNAEALLRPEAFVPKSLAKRFQNQLPLLSFDRDIPPEELAQRVLTVLIEVAAVAPPAQQTISTMGSPGAGSGQGRLRFHGPLPEKLHFLVVADEWQPHKGGLSTFNRDLCRGLGRAGHRVSLFVPRAGITPAEIHQIGQEQGIEIVHSEVAPKQLGKTELLLRPGLAAPPDVVIGHGMITGQEAYTLHKQEFPASRLVLFVHTAPSRIEPLKGKPPLESMRAPEDKDLQQADLICDADLVAAVGPLLRKSVQESLRSWKRKAEVFEFCPWFSAHEDHPPPGNKAALWIGRAEDAKLKGLDLAVRAVAQLKEKDPKLFVRGVAAASVNRVSQECKCWSQDKVDVELREYTAESSRIDHSYLLATVVLMPSRSEGFGLVGLEAIARGIPLLASSESGLAEVLMEHGGEDGRAAVVQVSRNDEETIDQISRKLQKIWDNPEEAFAQARRLRAALAPHLNERRSIAAFIQALRKVSQRP